MTVDLGSGAIVPGHPAQRKTRAVLIIIVVLAAMGWTATDIHSVLVMVLAALGILALSAA